MGVNNFDDRYNYYFYGVNGLCDVKESFNVGLALHNENVLERSLNDYVLSYGLDVCVSQFAKENGYDMVFVIKIPSYYLGWVHRNGKLEPFVPLLLSKYRNSFEDEVTIINSSLVEGVFNNNTLEYTSNNNYNPFYNPSGMKYADIQLSNMYKFGCYDLYSSGIRRDRFSYDELKELDDERNRWDRIIKHYSGSKILKVLKRIFK